MNAARKVAAWSQASPIRPRWFYLVAFAAGSVARGFPPVAGVLFVLIVVPVADLIASRPARPEPARERAR